MSLNEFIIDFNKKIDDMRDEPEVLALFLSMTGSKLLFQERLAFEFFLLENEYLDSWRTIKTSAMNINDEISDVNIDKDKITIEFTLDKVKHSVEMIDIASYIKMKFNNLKPEHLNILIAVFMTDEYKVLSQLDYISMIVKY